MHRTRRYATLSTVVEEIMPNVLALFGSPFETSREAALEIVRDACLGYQHSAKLLAENANGLLDALGTLKALNAAETGLGLDLSPLRSTTF